MKSFWNLSLFDSLRLAQLQRENKRLYRAYLLKDALVRTLDCTSEPLARDKLDHWLRWARRSRLEPFKRVALTVAKHAEGIPPYVRSGLSNGRTEGLNGKARTITRRAYGFHSAAGLIALLKRVLITPLKPSRVPELELTYTRGSYYRPYREYDQLRIAQATLVHKTSGRSLEVGALLVTVELVGRARNVEVPAMVVLGYLNDGTGFA